MQMGFGTIAKSADVLRPAEALAGSVGDSVRRSSFSLSALRGLFAKKPVSRFLVFLALGALFPCAKRMPCGRATMVFGFTAISCGGKHFTIDHGFYMCFEKRFAIKSCFDHHSVEINGMHG